MNTVLSTTRVTAATADARQTLREHVLLMIVVGSHMLIAMAICHLYPEKFKQGQQLEEFVGALVMGLVFALCAYALYVMLFKRPTELLRYLKNGLAEYLSKERILFATPVLLMMPLFASSFSIVKAAIPIVHPFSWDARLAAVDQFLHGGIQPWVWLHYALGHPVFTAIVNLAYHLWFFILIATVYWLAFAMEHRKLRMQFMLSFVLSWGVLGNLLATVFSSVGPCYYGHVVSGANPYADLLQYLHSASHKIPVLAMYVQDTLWLDYSQGTGSAALSISAMPSMHVASATLLALLGWRLNRAAGIALTIFAVLIVLGSIHLAWHYAVDGYVGVLGSCLIWFTVGRLPSLRAEVNHAA